METAPTRTSAEVIERIRAAGAAEQAAVLEQVELAILWAQLHPCPEDEQPAYWGELDLHGETHHPLAREGSPTVAEFAPAEFAAALGISFEAGQQLLGDGLELHDRLPRLMDHVRAGRIPVWRARRVAALTTDLRWDAAVHADKLLSACPERFNEVMAEKLVQEARLF